MTSPGELRRIRRFGPGDGTIVFIGAGATRADYPDVPLGDELLNAILDSPQEEPTLTDFLQKIFHRSALMPGAHPKRRPRLDDVFTLIDAHLAGRAPAPADFTQQRLLEVRARLVAAIGRVLDEALQGDPRPLSRALARALPRNGSVISTNYDMVLDIALAADDNVNYGISVRSLVEREGALPSEPERFREAHHFGMVHGAFEQRGTLSLLKLHGSLNWLYCPKCQELDVTLLGKGAVVVLDDPRRARCQFRYCTGRYETILVGPSLEQRYEHPVLADVWHRAEDALRSAERLIVIGYSLPAADYLIRALLARHFSRRSNQVLVVTQGSSRATAGRGIVERYRQLFPQCVFYWEGLEGFVQQWPDTAR